MAFDPSKYGAVRVDETPVTDPVKTGKFDPTKYGAVRVDEPVTPPVSTETPTQQPGLLKRIGGAFISSEKGLAESIGQSVAYLTGTGKQIDENNKRLIDSGDTLLGLAKTTADPIRKQNLINQAKEAYQLAGTSYEEVLPAIKKTGLQIAGEGLGTMLDVATAGTYRTAVKGAKAGQLLTKSPLIAKGAEKIGLTVTKPLATKTILPTAVKATGAGKPLLKSMATGAGIGYGYDVTGKLQEGATGAEALTPGLGTAVGLAIPIAAKGIQKTGILANKAERGASAVSKVEEEIANIERNYARTRPLIDKNSPARKLIAQSDVLVGAVDDTGTISTKLKGGAIDKFKSETIDGLEGVVKEGLNQEGIAISPNIVREQMEKSILNSKLEGDALNKALKKIDSEIEGLMKRATPEGNIPLSRLQDSKIFTTGNIDYTKPASKIEAKAFANAYKTLIENNSKLPIKQVNSELAKYYEAIDLLETLDGKKVKGGKLGKYAARIGGYIVGSSAGGAIGGIPGMAVGTIAGGEAAAKIQGMLMSKTFGKGVGTGLEKSAILEKAGQEFPQARKLLPEKASVKQTPIILPEKLPAVQGQIKSPSDLRPPKERLFIQPLKNNITQSLPIKKIEEQSIPYSKTFKEKVQEMKSNLVFPNSEMEYGYEEFNRLLRDPKLRTSKAKEAILNGDEQTLKRELFNRGVATKEDVDNMLYSGEYSNDEVLEKFKERLVIENPNLIFGKKNSQNLGFNGEIPY